MPETQSASNGGYQFIKNFVEESSVNGFQCSDRKMYRLYARRNINSRDIFVSIYQRCVYPGCDLGGQFNLGICCLIRSLKALGSIGHIMIFRNH